MKRHKMNISELSSAAPKMDALVEKNRQNILSIAREKGIRNVRVFGSMARNDANEESDLDLLVELEEGQSGFALGGFLDAVSKLVHRKVDVVTEKSLHPSRYWVLSSTVEFPNGGQPAAAVPIRHWSLDG